MNVIFQSWFTESSLRLITPFILLAVGFIVETRYVSRVAMFANAAALYIFYHPINMSIELGIIVNVVIIIGLIGGFSRLFNISLVSQFYQIAWIASSVVTAFLLLVGMSL